MGRMSTSTESGSSRNTSASNQESLKTPVISSTAPSSTESTPTTTPKNSVSTVVKMKKEKKPKDVEKRVLTNMALGKFLDCIGTGYQHAAETCESESSRSAFDRFYDEIVLSDNKTYDGCDSLKKIKADMMKMCIKRVKNIGERDRFREVLDSYEYSAAEELAALKKSTVEVWSTNIMNDPTFSSNSSMSSDEE